jgi:hypothetical protein
VIHARLLKVSKVNGESLFFGDQQPPHRAGKPAEIATVCCQWKMSSAGAPTTNHRVRAPPSSRGGGSADRSSLAVLDDADKRIERSDISAPTQPVI